MYLVQKETRRVTPLPASCLTFRPIDGGGRLDRLVRGEDIAGREVRMAGGKGGKKSEI